MRKPGTKKANNPRQATHDVALKKAAFAAISATHHQGLALDELLVDLRKNGEVDQAEVLQVLGILQDEKVLGCGVTSRIGADTRERYIRLR